MALIQVKNLKKEYDDGTIALKDVSFEINQGEFVSIMGPSGSGKSTLLHIIGFLDRHSSGHYLFEGKPADRYTEDELAAIRNQKMGFVFQAFNLLPKASVYENIALPLIYSGIPEREWPERIMSVIETVGLSHRVQHESTKLSGGEKQRVAIARALVAGPQVIFADEPTGNLDSKSGQLVMDKIQTLHEQFGHTIILITHETATAEHAKRIIKVRDGLIESDEAVLNQRTARSSFEK